jgi:hypothetical protein
MPLKYKKHEAKDWARQNWHGLCNVIVPSYSSDLKRLNESGIRHDVRQNIELGYWGLASCLIPLRSPHALSERRSRSIRSHRARPA